MAGYASDFGSTRERTTGRIFEKTFMSAWRKHANGRKEDIVDLSRLEKPFSTMFPKEVFFYGSTIPGGKEIQNPSSNVPADTCRSRTMKVRHGDVCIEAMKAARKFRISHAIVGTVSLEIYLNAELQSKNPLLKIHELKYGTHLEPEQLFALKRLILEIRRPFWDGGDSHWSSKNQAIEFQTIPGGQASMATCSPIVQEGNGNGGQRNEAAVQRRKDGAESLSWQSPIHLATKDLTRNVCGVLNRDADALSRYAVGQNPSDAEDVMNAQVMTLEEIDMRVEQQSDKFCGDLISFLEGNTRNPSDRLKRLSTGST
ncbi:hypothetical protein BV898_19758 [Hypsibius exemplaris]|uniref:Uncharacterized protein n=1 Tax=Hypsibius exemplaris TaxID=2072580 RepID=A0A9X6NSQ7_HYPEX|nr:hypothetical protein BV898_19758 [Hypsibius exemplaris]